MPRYLLVFLADQTHQVSNPKLRMPLNSIGKHYLKCLPTLQLYNIEFLAKIHSISIKISSKYSATLTLPLPYLRSFFPYFSSRISVWESLFLRSTSMLRELTVSTSSINAFFAVFLLICVLHTLAVFPHKKSQF